MRLGGRDFPVVTRLFRGCNATVQLVSRSGLVPCGSSLGLSIVASTGQKWPGQRLGLPESGPRSIARLGRRIGAILIDWSIALLISWAFFRGEDESTNGFVTLGLFAAEQYLFLALLGGSIGHLLLRMRVVPLRGGYLGVWRPLVRTVLLCLFIPAVIWDVDQRGLHDKIAGSILVRV